LALGTNESVSASGVVFILISSRYRPKAYASRSSGGSVRPASVPLLWLEDRETVLQVWGRQESTMLPLQERNRFSVAPFCPWRAWSHDTSAEQAIS